MWESIKNILKRKDKQKDRIEKDEKKEWLESLFENIEYVKKQELIVPFKIIDIKNNGFEVKIQGLYGYIPFNRMPWNYRNIECWEAVAPSLKEVCFEGKVIHIDRFPDSNEISRIVVDAKKAQFEDIDLYSDEDYKGIVFTKAIYGAFVDIGVHFGWKFGSIQGLLHISNFPDPDSFVQCEAGQHIKINIINKKDKGYEFKDVRSIDLREMYVGKTVQVKTVRNNINGVDFLIEDKYKAMMPCRKDIYGDEADFVLKSLKSIPDGSIIECEVLDVSRFNIFIIKMLQHNDIINKVDLFDRKIKTYIGNTIKVEVIIYEDYSLDFKKEDTFKVSMPLTKEYYKEKLGVVKTIVKDFLEDGDIIECEAMDVDFNAEIIFVKFLFENYFLNYVGKTVKVRISINKKGALEYLVLNKYNFEMPVKAKMPTTKIIYGEDKDRVLKTKAFLQEGAIIDCEVLEINKFNNFKIKLLPHCYILSEADLLKRLKMLSKKGKSVK
jgi:hypothetical protein